MKRRKRGGGWGARDGAGGRRERIIAGVGGGAWRALEGGGGRGRLHMTV